MLQKQNKRLKEQLNSVVNLYLDFLEVSGISLYKDAFEDYWISIEEYMNDTDMFELFEKGFGISRFYVIDYVSNELMR